MASTPLSSDEQRAQLGRIRRKPMQRDMFTGNLVSKPPKAGRGDHIVLKRESTEPTVVPGMAHFPGTGPEGKRCQHCAHFGDIPAFGRQGRTTRELAELKEDTQPRRIEKDACRKCADLYDGFVQKGGIRFQPACKYFAESR